MGEGFSGENALWVVYLVVYLLAMVGWLRRDRQNSRTRREAPASTKPGLNTWLTRHPWAPGGALWATIVWVALAVGGWWYGEGIPKLVTLPLTTLAGFVTGWLLSITVGRRSD